MSIKLFNTFTRYKEVFTPIEPHKVMMYMCGVTVYDYCHIGHARAYVAFDCVRRYLLHQNYDVNFVQNFTDIDDKIIKRAEETGEVYTDLTRRFIAAYHEDMAFLNVMPASSYPCATGHMGQIIVLIKGLIKKGMAYEAGGDVCFSIEAFDTYGRLSKKVLDELEAGARVTIDDAKKHPFDFVLWKQAKDGEPFWHSPWGKGRPGWHIECSAMAMHCLAETIDIHAGGADLIFPHHENERAQSECFTGKPFANYWMHNGFVTIDNEKMGKSLNNFFTIRDVLTQYEGEIVRFFLMKVQYRSPLNYSLDGLKEAEQALERLRTTLKNVKEGNPKPEFIDQFETLTKRFYKAMDDDFNTAEAIGVLFDVNKLINTTQSGTQVLKTLGGVLGLFYSGLDKEVVLTAEEQQVVAQRNQAKKDKNFVVSDRLRERLLSEFFLVIEDTPEGVRLKRV